MASQEPPASPSKPILESPTESWIIRFYETGSNVVDFRGRTFSNIIHRNDEYLHHNDDYLHLLFPTPESPPVVDREIVLAFRTRQALKDQLRKAYLRILRLYGFKCVVSKQTGKLWLQNLEGWSIEGAPAGDYLSHSSKHHSRFNRILFSLRLLGFEQEALIFHEKLCELIGKKVQPAYRLAWERSMKADLTPMLSLGSPENDKEQGPPVDGALQDKPPKPNAPASKQDTKARKPSKDKYAAQQPEDRASALASWKTEALPPQVKVRPVFGPSIIPSPLAPGGVDAHDWSTLPETLRRRFSNRVATLWYSAFEQHSAGANDAEIQEKIAELDKEDGQNLVCYLESIPATDATSTATSTTTTTAIAAAAHFESIPLRKVILPPALFPANDIFTLVGRAAILGKKLKITFCALENRAHGSIDTFIYNPWHASFRVNGVPLPPSLLAGPLSPFSIIEAESAVVFWFRDRDACNYVPGLLSKPRRKRSHDEIGDGDTAETPENIPL